MITHIEGELNTALKYFYITVSREKYTIPTGSEDEKRAAKSKAGADVQAEFKSSPNHVECNVNELAEYMGTGHCVRGMIHSPADETNTIKGKFNTEKAFERQTVILLDFDNKTDPPRPELQTADGVREFINKTISEYIGQTVNAVSVVSESVSSTAKLRKWHAALVLETPINDFKSAKRIITYIVSGIFGGVADSACTDPARLIFGSTTDKITAAYNGYLTTETVTALENVIREKEQSEKAEKAAKAAKAAARQYASIKFDNSRLAEIILNAHCDFTRLGFGYVGWLNTCTALYHIAGVPSECIITWSEPYNGTTPNPAQWETMNKNGTFSEGTLIWAAKLLDRAAFDDYLKELRLAEVKTEFAPFAEHVTAHPTPDIDSLTETDINTGGEIYNYISTFFNNVTGTLNEDALNEYRGRIAEHIRSQRFKCKTTFEKRFDSRVKLLQKSAKIIKDADDKSRLDAMKEGLPDWVIPSLTGVNKIDENKFADSFVSERGEIKCINGTFYDINGELTRSKIEGVIYNKISKYISQSVAFRARVLCDVLALKCYSEPITPDGDKIHVMNGTLTRSTKPFTDPIKGEERRFVFSPAKEFCTVRLDVGYSCGGDRPPEKWLAFLNELLEEEDQKTLQEYFGYCLLPTTAAQKALFIIGNGGEGKSIIGGVMGAIFGSGMVSGSVDKLSDVNRARFALAPLVNRLIMCDDDINLSALENTAVIKQIVTAQIPLEIEQKGVPSYQAVLFSRIIAFGNGALSSLYDNSEGFWRRQLILSAKPKDPNREDDPELLNKLLTEKNSIFTWALRGLERLLKNNYKFTVSEKTVQTVEEKKRESNNVLSFMESDSVIIDHNNTHCVTCTDLYNIYCDWCEENALNAKKRKTFVNELNTNSRKYGIEYNENIVANNGHRVRGFTGIRGNRTALPRYDTEQK
jgi:putative DNA primase/helicase